MKQWLWISILSLTATAIHTGEQFRLFRREMDIQDTYLDSLALGQRSSVHKSSHNLQRHHYRKTRQWTGDTDSPTLRPRMPPPRGRDQTRSVSPKPKKMPYERAKESSPDPNILKFSPPKMPDPVSAHNHEHVNNAKSPGRFKSSKSSSLKNMQVTATERPLDSPGSPRNAGNRQSEEAGGVRE